MELLLHVSMHGSFYSEFWHFTYNSTKKESRTIEKIGIRKFFIHFIPKRNRYTLQGVISLFFFFFFLHNLINLLQLSILLNL